MNASRIAVRRWPRGTPRNPDAVERQMQSEQLPYYRWSNAPGDVYGAHHHAYDKVIYVLEGSITFALPEDGSRITLSAGDRLYLPAGVSHQAVVGSQGVVCLEGHRQPV